ncbi:MAG: hypothetical protein L0I76_30180 [Pseudonocardia sp.]|nr:hypothetical protein [Pseudonocardia sp.]
MAANFSLGSRARKLPRVNRRALRKYGEFWRALQMVGDAVQEAEKVAAKTADSGRVKASAGASAKTFATTSGGTGGGEGGRHWSAATPDELKSSAKKAQNSLRVMATSAKKWEAELISRDWRK